MSDTNDILKDIENGVTWFKCEHSKRRCDLSIRSFIYRKPDVKGIQFTVRHGKLDALGKYILIGLTASGNRLIFKEGKEDGGILLSSNVESKNSKYARIAAQNDVKYLLNFTGDYNIICDEKTGLYYAEKREEI